MKPPRGLSAAEAALWARVTATVTPLSPLPLAGGGGGGSVDDRAKPADSPTPNPSRKREGDKSTVRPARPPVPLHHASHGLPPRTREDRVGLDDSWERKLARAAIAPDFTLDLHGHTLDQAHARLDSGLIQAKAMDARLVLLITGKPRPAQAADRGTQRGAIRAKVLDWLAAGPHAPDIAAIRKAHRRHGGDGALYIVLKRRR